MRVEIPLTVAGVGVTVIAGLLFLVGAVDAVSAAMAQGQTTFALETALFALLGAALVFGNLAYQLARLGYLRRLRDESPEAPAAIDHIYDQPVRPLHILVPSYQEETRVIRQTLLSAALQAYPNKHIALLIDDDPEPATADKAALLLAARNLPATIQALLQASSEWAANARSEFLDAELRTEHDRVREALALASVQDSVASFFEDLAQDEEVGDHTDALFVNEVLRAPAREYRTLARALRERASHGHPPSDTELARGYARVAALFDARLTAFERKRYVNLSREPNKAMNLNTYVDLIGERVYEVTRADGTYLLKASELDPADHDEQIATRYDVPRSDIVVTLDADSLLLPDYVVRLVSELNRPGNERVAVIQTPYSAIPGAHSALEQTAGATTDIQYIIHQGFTRHDSTFWVGANAVIRKAALDDIATDDVERGHPVRRFIQDRTVIEDTESTVDLVSRGWTLVNYPARLSFSATPADFGALVIQRQRWANGGLIILPKLLHHLWSRLSHGRAVIAEGFMRTHYLVSIAATNIALLVMLAYPFSDHVASVWLPIASLPYFVLYARDLRQSGYQARDMLRVYALNLLLLPVNLAGVAKSLQQAVTRRKIPFGRTPKIAGRTAAPVRHHLAVIGLIGFWITGSAIDLAAGRVLHGVFAAVNAAFLVYAMTRFVGWGAVFDDIRSQLRLPVSLPAPARGDPGNVARR